MGGCAGGKKRTHARFGWLTVFHLLRKFWSGSQWNPSHPWKWRLTMTIAKRVRDCRYAKGWGPDELASRAAISRTALYQIECGKTETPRAGTLRRIAEALGVPIEALLGSEAEVSPVVSAPAPAEHPSWMAEESAPRRLMKIRNGRSHLVADPDLYRKFQEVLASPLGESFARLLDETHRLVVDSESRVGI